MRRYPVVVIALALTLPAFSGELDFHVHAGDRHPDATQAPSAQTASEIPQADDGLRSLLHDPHDGKLDMSRWLLEHRGFLPVPIIVSDPALDYGGGVGLAFFHRPTGAATTRTTADGRQQMVPPNIYGVAGMKTGNGSYAYGAGASLHVSDDRWRYTGLLGKGSFNLDFYTPGVLLPPVAIGYNTRSTFTYQKISRRIGAQPLYVGVSWLYMNQDIKLRCGVRSQPILKQ